MGYGYFSGQNAVKIRFLAVLNRNLPFAFMERRGFYSFLNRWVKSIFEYLTQNRIIRCSLSTEVVNFFSYKFLRLNSILYAYLQTVFKGKEIIISFYPRIYQINFTLEKGRTFFLIVSSKDDFNMKDRSLTKTLI